MYQHYPFPQVPLPYSYVSLMPGVYADNLYDHHQYYYSGVRALNRAAVRMNVMDKELKELIGGELNLPPLEERLIRDRAGMVYNHQLYFQSLRGERGVPPENAITQELEAVHGSMENFRRLVMEAGDSLIGSGWLWLILEGGGLHLALTPNNETVSLGAVTPILVIDLWEHSYFPVHHFDRGAYINDCFHRINWSLAEQNFLRGQGVE